LLLIGVHRDVEVTDVQGPQRQVVSQAFCSALPVRYTRQAGKARGSFVVRLLGTPVVPNVMHARERGRLMTRGPDGSDINRGLGDRRR
jgi:hypothetical protein